MEKYTKSHENEIAAKGHVKNIKKRGGTAKLNKSGNKFIVEYSFGNIKTPINTIKNCLIAQNYSDAAKSVTIYKEDLHFKEIEKIRSKDIDLREINNLLYYEKDNYLKKAFISAEKENVNIFYDEIEGVLYFEFLFGQCSFHTFMDEKKFPKNVKVVEEYKWSGKDNTRKLLMDNYK